MLGILRRIICCTTGFVFMNMRSIVCMIIVEIIQFGMAVRHLDMTELLGIMLIILAVVIEIFGMCCGTILRNIFHCADMSVIVSLLGMMAA